jgi:hypothetical protein
MNTMGGFAEAASVSSSSVEGNELDAWLQRYQLLRSSLYGVAETPADYHSKLSDGTAIALRDVRRD